MQKILIVDDDKLVSMLYRKKLQEVGFAVEVVHDGQEGFYRIHDTKFAAVVLDLMLPQISGLDILKKIRAQKQFETLPVFVLTNSFLQEIGKEAQALGVARVLDKGSTTPRILADELMHVLGIRSHPTSEPGSSLASEADVDAVKEISSEMSALRGVFQNLSKSREQSTHLTFLFVLVSLAHKLTGHAAALNLRRTAHLAAALEALLENLVQKPDQVNPSTLRTIASTLDLLPSLPELDTRGNTGFPASFTVMAVDDDQFARKAVAHALAKIGLKIIAIADSSIALKLGQENAFDLILLDVEMPDINGFDLCRDLRKTTANQKTPVVFVTGLDGFDARADSALSGGTDLLAKPFLPMELALKALAYIYARDLPLPR